MELAVSKAIEVLGPMGRILPQTSGEKINYDARVSTVHHGCIWYGDLLASELGKLELLLKILGADEINIQV